MKQHFQHRHQQEQSDADADRHDQHCAVDHSGDLRRQHLQIRFRHRDEHAHQKTDGQQCRYFTRPGQSCTDMLAHRGHCHVRPQIEQRHADDKHHGRQKKDGQLPGCQTD